LSESHNFTSFLKRGVYHCLRYDVGEQRTGRDENVRTRHKLRSQRLAPLPEEVVQSRDVAVVQNSETRDWCALVTTYRRRNSPYTAPPLPKFPHLGWRVFEHAVRRIGYDGLERPIRLLGEPTHAISLMQLHKAGWRNDDARNGLLLALLNQ